MNSFRVEKDVPIQSSVKGRHGLYPWRDMKPGDSFWCPPREGESPRDVQSRIAAAAHGAAERRGLTYTTRVEGSGARVWLLPADYEEKDDGE